MNDIDKQVQDAMDKAAADIAPPAAPAVPQRTTNLRPVETRTSGTLPEQLVAYERVRKELGERIRREMLRLEHEYRQRRAACIADHDIRIHEATARMEETRDRELAELAREYHGRVKDVEDMAKRMGGED